MQPLFCLARLAAVAALCAVVPAMAQQRLATIPPAAYTDEQKQAAAEFEAARKTPVFGPFEPLLYSPRLMNQARALGDYLRFKPSIGTVLSELVILITAREWTQDYEWYVHQPEALKAGLKPELVEAIREGRRPQGMAEDEETLFEFVTELNRTRRVSDKTYERAVKAFSEKGVIDIVGIQGYYALLAMALNVSRFELPKDGQRLPRFPE